MAKRPVGEGESTSSIAKQTGHFWKKLWDHPENAGLKQLRKDPNVLFADDLIHVPPIEIKEVPKPTEQRHKFKRKGEPCRLKLQLLKLGKPRANEEYVLEIEGKLIKGKTDAEGKLEHQIPGDAKSGRLTLRGGKESFPVRIGQLDPVDQTTGVQQRLNNLAYDCGAEDGEIGERTVEALKKFQAEHKLQVTGEADAATKAKLKELSK
jgi:N-acetylmuramoyl-L-alanine amidase